MKEKLIMKFNLPEIEKITLIDEIVSTGYQKTFKKFSVEFNGSKGYLDHINISCEMHRGEDNRIDLYHLRNKDGSLKNTTVNIFYSETQGIRVSTGKDQPRNIKPKSDEVSQKKYDDDLDF